MGTHHLTDHQLAQLLLRNSIQTLHKVGFTAAQIRRYYKCDPKTIKKWCLNDQTVLDAPRSGHPKKITNQQKRKIVKLLENKEFTGVRPVAAQISESGPTISRETVRTVALAAGLSPEKPVQKPLMKFGMKHKRRLFATEFKDYDWSTVVFVDEASFYCYKPPNPRFSMKWVRPGTKREPLPRVAHGAKVHVFAAFRASGPVLLHIFTENFTSSVYINILEHELKPIISDWKHHWVYLADKSPIHTSRRAQAWLNDNVPEHIAPKQWPAHSPDLNPIENAWAILKHRVAMTQPKTIQTLREAVETAWNEVMTPDLCNTLATSMKKRLTAVVTLNGGHTKY